MATPRLRLSDYIPPLKDTAVGVLVDTLLTWKDSIYLYFGTDQDAWIVHDGTNLEIEDDTGAITIDGATGFSIEKAGTAQIADGVIGPAFVATAACPSYTGTTNEVLLDTTNGVIYVYTGAEWLKWNKDT